MNVEVENVALLTKKVNIGLPKEIVQSKEEEIYGSLRDTVAVPGFRKGKVPLTILKKRFSKDVEVEIIKALIPEYCEKAFKEQNLLPVETPKVENVDYKEGDSLKFTATCEVYPDITPEGYMDADIDAPVEEVTEENINETLKNLQSSYGELIVKEGENDATVEKNDQVIVNLDCSIDDKEVKGLFRKHEGYEIDAGSHKFVPAIEDDLIGKKKGDTLEHDVLIPEIYYNKEYAGKNIKIKTTVEEIKLKKLPELNDEFAKMISGEYESLADLKTAINKELSGNTEIKRRNKMKENLQRILVEKNSFDIPPSILKQATDRELFNDHIKLLQEGRDWDLMKRDPTVPGKEVEKKAKDEATYFILVNKIVEKEKITAEEEEFKKSLIQHGIKTGAKFENGMPRLSDADIQNVEFALLEDKLLSLIISKAKQGESENSEDKK